MIKYKLKYMEAARNNLKDIRDYLSQFYPGTTRNFTKEIKKQVSLLMVTPLMCEQYHDNPYYRKMIIEDYLVFYHVDDEKLTVEIHRILHGSRDIKRYI